MTEQDRTIAAPAEADGISRQATAIHTTDDAAARKVQESQVSELSEAALTRYADLLHRLSQ